jgi:hypothetical protein
MARILIGLLVLTAACGRAALRPADAPVELDAERRDLLFRSLADGCGHADRASGSLRFAASTPDGAERGTIRFSADRSRTLLEFRNSLGIEGVRILVDSDSITVYDRIDGTAEKGALGDVRIGAFDGALRVPLLDLLDPDCRHTYPVQAFETAHSWSFRFPDGRILDFDRRDRHPTRYESGNLTATFDETEMVDGYRFARRITLRTRDGRTAVQLRLQSLQPNPVSLDLDLRLPTGTVIRRL